MPRRHPCLLLIVSCLLLLAPPVMGQGSQALGQDAKLTLPDSDEGLPGSGPIRRYDWFRNLWNRKRAGWANDVKQDQGALVFLGDSITQGWGPKMKGAFGDLKVANRGISGDTTRGMLVRLPEDVLALHPRGVVILAGTNDLEEGASPETIAGNMKLIIADLKKHNPKLPIVLCNVFPSSASKARPKDAIQKINQLYFEAVKGDPQITVVDTWLLFANEAGDAKREEFPDLLHPNDAGYQKWAAAITPILATLGMLETKPEKFEPEPGFESLFNGKDLTGWCFRNRKSLETTESFDGQSSTKDGRFVALHGKLIVTTPPEGRRFQQLWTTREFPRDFVLKLQFRATPNADSGVFIRKPQLQCRDYWLAGPYKDLKKYKPQQWNQLEATVRGGVAHCTCNGEVLEAEFKLPATGPIGLEGDRGQMEYRHIQIKVLAPATNANRGAARWEATIAKFEAQDKQSPPPKNGVLFVGSSSIRLWDLDKWFPNANAINRGFGGSEVSDSLHFVDRIVLPHKPRVIVMYAGDNDIAKGVAPGDVAKNFADFVRAVHQELPKAKIVYVAVKPSLKRWSLIDKVRDTNKQIAEQCKRNALLEFVDIDTPMIGDDGKPRPELFAKDGLHLSDKGYAMWSQLVAPHIK